MPRNVLFAIVNVSTPSVVEERFKDVTPSLHLALVEPGQWLLMAPSGTTTQELSVKLGIHDGKTNGIVLKVDNYAGRTRPDVWEWIAAKLEVDLGTATKTAAV